MNSNKLIECNICGARFKRKFMQRKLPRVCLNCGNETSWLQCDDEPVKPVNITLKKSILLRCMDCGYRWWAVEKTLCPRCHNEYERSPPIHEFRFPINVFFRNKKE